MFSIFVSRHVSLSFFVFSSTCLNKCFVSLWSSIILSYFQLNLPCELCFRTSFSLKRSEYRSMSQRMEEYHSNESEDKTSWDWSKAINVGKKVMKVGVVVSSAPFLVPPLVFTSTFAFLASIPYCLFLANYACTQKLMSTLLPITEETSGIENDESELDFRKPPLHGEGTTEVDESSLIQNEEDEEIAKESTRLVEKLRDEGRNDRRISEKDDENLGKGKSEKVQDHIEKQEQAETGHEEELGDTTTKTFKGKDEETSSNEVYSEEQIWEKMEALRKVVGYSLARSGTYAEELKALYIFTGVVEPSPSSLNHDINDITQFTLRLRFLMSLVGIN